MSYCVIPGCFQPENPDSHRNCQSCGSKLWLRERYRPIQLIGQGGFGRTFLAIDQDIPSQPYCVIKQLCSRNADAYSLRKATELFHQEAVRLEELGNHAQIPGLFAHFEQNRWLYLVQEFIDGQSLEQELQQKGAFSEAQILDLLRDLLPVLQFIHGHQVIHRDIKPPNIMRCKQDQKLVLIDFGIAKQMTGATLAQTGTVVGTLDYMAPEQLRGKAIAASDLYSLGVTCIHLLTKLPASDLFDTTHDCWAWRDRLPSNMSMNTSLEQVLNKMLAGAISKRYKSAEAVLQDLSKATMRAKRLAVAKPQLAVDQPIVIPIAEIQQWLGAASKRPLASSMGIDYTSLHSFLLKGKWKEADEETWAMMCQAVKKPRGSYLFNSDIERLPCDDLRTIDQLWIKHSRGRFGFSIQTRIYAEVSGDYGSFCDRIGWVPHSSSTSDNYLRFDLRSPVGHLPSRSWVGGFQWWQHASAIAKRLAICSQKG